MSQQNDLRPVLAATLRLLKDQQETLDDVMNQVAALRDILKEASPTFSEAFSNRVDFWRKIKHDTNVQSRTLLDRMIQTLGTE